LCTSKPTSSQRRCPYKGKARYYSIKIDGKLFGSPLTADQAASRDNSIVCRGLAVHRLLAIGEL
jgi:Domain of unknown function (DUF427)